MCICTMCICFCQRMESRAGVCKVVWYLSCFHMGGGVEANNVLWACVTSDTPLILRCEHFHVASNTLLMLRSEHGVWGCGGANNILLSCVTSNTLLIVSCGHFHATSHKLLMLRSEMLWTWGVAVWGANNILLSCVTSNTLLMLHSERNIYHALDAMLCLQSIYFSSLCSGLRQEIPNRHLIPPGFWTYTVVAIWSLHYGFRMVSACVDVFYVWGLVFDPILVAMYGIHHWRCDIFLRRVT